MRYRSIEAEVLRTTSHL